MELEKGRSRRSSIAQEKPTNVGIKQDFAFTSDVIWISVTIFKFKKGGVLASFPSL